MAWSCFRYQFNTAMAMEVSNRSPAKDLKKILQSSKFCTVCLDVSGSLLHLDYSLDTGNLGEDALCLRELLEGIFKDVNDIVISDYICKSCKSSAANSYAFITKAKKTAQELNKYLTQLDRGITNLTIDKTDGEQKSTVIVVDICNYAFETEPEKLSYTRDICVKSNHRRNLIKHLKHPNVTDSRTLKCLHCRTRPCLHEKYLLGYNEQRMQGLEQITCVECNEKIGKTVQHLIAHVNKVHLDIQTNICKECGKAFYLEYDYKKHLKYHNSKYTCVWCSKKFRSKIQLSSHIETCNKTVKTIKCSNPVLPETKFPFQNHLAREMEQSMELTQAKNRNIYKCLMCNKVLNTKLELRKHIRKMHDKKPNLCLYCNKQFDSRKMYLDHVQTEEHRKKVPFNHHCTHCDYAANSAIMLTAHMNRIHLNIRPFTCEYCQKSYFDNAQLKNHMKIHTGQVKHKVCDICGAHLAGPTALIKHRRLHTGEKPYSCAYCDVKMNCASSLKYHVMRKHMEPTVSCPLCNLKFHTMNNARGHVRKTHWKSKEKFDYTKLQGLSPKDYDFFRDRRKALIGN